MSPLVSVLMTAYNREKYIAEAIQSVLVSTYERFELIIVDDCSTDNTVEIASIYAAKDSRIRLFLNDENLGDYPNRNRAATYAKGEYLMYVDSDDAIKIDHISRALEVVGFWPDVKLVLPSRMHDNFRGTKKYKPSDAYYQHFYVDGFLETGPLGALIDHSVYSALNGFSGRRMIGDVEFYLRLSREFQIARMDSSSICTRIGNIKESQIGEYFYLVEIVGMYRTIVFNKLNPLYKRRYSLILRKFFELEYVIFKKFIKSIEIKYLHYLLRNINNLFGYGS